MEIEKASAGERCVICTGMHGCSKLSAQAQAFDTFDTEKVGQGEPQVQRSDTTNWLEPLLTLYGFTCYGAWSQLNRTKRLNLPLSCSISCRTCWLILVTSWLLCRSS